MKSVCIRSFSGPYFPAFRLNTDEKNSEYRHFSSSGLEFYFFRVSDSEKSVKIDIPKKKTKFKKKKKEKSLKKFFFNKVAGGRSVGLQR